jgi:hypothetical protein
MNHLTAPSTSIPPHDTRFRLSDRIRFAESRGEVIIMETEAQRMLGVDGPGAQALSRWSKGATFGEVVDALLAEYEVERAELERDLVELIDEARRRGWIV